METRAHYVAVGAFVLMMVFAAFVAALWLGGVELTTHYARYDIYFRGPVTGLSKGAAVEYNGIPVGRVFEIRIDPEDVERIRVTVEIDDAVIIKEDAKAEVESNILSGVAYILITKGTQEAAPLTAKPGQRYPVIASRRSTLASVYARGPALLDQLSRIGDHLDELLDEHNRQAVADTLDNLRKITGAVANRDKDIGEVVENANHSLAALNKLLDSIDQALMAEGGIKDRANLSLDQLAKLLADADAATHDMQATLREARPAVRELSQRTVPQIEELLRETRQFVAGLTRLGEQIERDPSRLLFGDRREGYRPK
jgi:phospholipid/cholesterol/gamma-HCH transport system substrate-binding protein